MIPDHAWDAIFVSSLACLHTVRYCTLALMMRLARRACMHVSGRCLDPPPADMSEWML